MAGYKNFIGGAILGESDLDDFLMRQTVMRFANAAARDSALSSILTEGLLAYLIDVDLVTIYDGSVWVPINGTRRVSGSTTTMTASFAAVTGATLTLPAGLWQVCSKAQVSPDSANAILRIRDTTNSVTVDTLTVGIGAGANLSAFLEGPLTATGSTTVRLESMVSGISGTQQVIVPTLWANHLLP